MPAIDTVPVTMYQPDMPYHYLYDNLPIQGILSRLDDVNAQVDIDAQTLRNSAGTAGTLDNRLNTSLDGLGNLLQSAVDNTLHHIGYHTDGIYPGDGNYYVRYLLTERDKLAAIAAGATNLAVGLPNEPFNSGVVSFINSPTVTWCAFGQELQANLTFPVSAIHQFIYDAVPAFNNSFNSSLSSSSSSSSSSIAIIPDYQNYKVNTLSTPFIQGTLRVYVNGIRLTKIGNVYYPSYASSPEFQWKPLSYTENYAAGTFQLSTPITADDVIRIDYDLYLPNSNPVPCSSSSCSS